MYSDATTCDGLGKTSRHPVYLTLGNIPFKRRNEADAKVLLGYIPILKASNDTDKLSSGFHTANREIFQQSMNIILQPLLNQYETGTFITVNNQQQHVVAKIGPVIADWPEACKFTLTYCSSNASCPCHNCLTPQFEFNNMKLLSQTIKTRTEKVVKNVLDNNLGKEYSVHNTQNIFWKHM